MVEALIFSAPASRDEEGGNQVRIKPHDETTMRMNQSLTDAEVAEGYILTCQAHATSAELIVSFDE